MMKKFFSVIVYLCLGFGAGFLLCGPFCNHGRGELRYHTDTLVLRDTFIREMPVPIETLRIDTMYVAIRDTTVIRDTAYVILEREQKHYRDELYDAWVSGYSPALDSLKIYPETRYITTQTNVLPKPAKRWSIGIQAGYGLAFTNPTPQFSPYLGVGITYKLIEF